MNMNSASTLSPSSEIECINALVLSFDFDNTAQAPAMDREIERCLQALFEDPEQEQGCSQFSCAGYYPVH